MIAPEDVGLPSKSSKRIGTGRGDSGKGDVLRREGSMKLSEAPESMSAKRGEGEREEITSGMRMDGVGTAVREIQAVRDIMVGSSTRS